jgi:very-short-patch-repair endonuclease
MVDPMSNSGGEIHAGRGKLPQSAPVDRLVGQIAARQERLVTLRQLYALDLTDRQIRMRVERGLLHVLHRGVFIVGPPNITPRGHLKGALLALGDQSFLSHRASIAVQGLRPINTRKVELTVVASSTPSRPGLIIHRTATPPHRREIRDRFGLRYSSLSRALVEVAPDERSGELMRLVTVGIRKGLVDLGEIDQTIARHDRCPGTGILRSALGRYLDPSDRKSELERSFDAHCARDARIPPYDKNVHLGPHEWDVLFGPQRLLVELDGRPYHVSIQDMENDRAKAIWAQRQGFWIMRITDFTWEHDRAQAIDDLLALLALGGWLPQDA